MYHRIVAMQVRNAFAQISAGNWEAMVAGMAPAFTYRFYGDHALSGERHTRYQNVVHQFLRIRWGKITEVRTLEDTAVLQKTLDRLAAAGYAEAHAAPITDQ